jgi:hypothetical protein
VKDLANASGLPKTSFLIRLITPGSVVVELGEKRKIKEIQKQAFLTSA